MTVGNGTDYLMTIFRFLIDRENPDYDIICEVIRLFEALSHSETYIQTFTDEEIIKELIKLMIKANDLGMEKAVNAAVCALAFYTHNEKNWMSLINPKTMAILFKCMRGKNEVVPHHSIHQPSRSL
jgi:hypothetical protein